MTAGYSRTRRRPERPFYKDSEIEAICEDALRSVSLLPGSPLPVRIDRFIEKRFGVFPSYEDLPEGVLGLTIFSTRGVEAVCLSRTLDDGGKVAERRVRSTLAHEGGHGLLHAHLFPLGDAELLFGDGSDPAKPKVLCRDESVEGPSRSGYDGRWWEFQANSAMSCLLLPRPLVEKALGPYVLEQGSFGLRGVNPRLREEGARALAEIFDVNPVFAKLRIEKLFPQSGDNQLAL